MSVLITGSSGLVQIGPTSALTTVGLVSEFSVECATDITTKGPYIGDATKRKVRSSKTSSGSLSAGTNFRLSLRGGDATNGYTYVAANCAISGLTFTGNAEEGYSFEFNFEDMDGYTLLVSA
jgi:hypothetical protein